MPASSPSSSPSSSRAASSELRSGCRSWLRSLYFSFDHHVEALPFGLGFLVAGVEAGNPCLVREQFGLARHRAFPRRDLAVSSGGTGLDEDVFLSRVADLAQG